MNLARKLLDVFGLFITTLFLSKTSSISVSASSKLEPIGFKGYAEMVDLNTRTPFHIEFVSGHSFTNVQVKITKGDIVLTNKTVVSRYLNEQIYYGEIFLDPDESKQITVSLFYTEFPEVEASTVSFELKSPHYQTFNMLGIDNTTIKDKNPVKVNFEACGETSSYSYEYEKISFEAVSYIDLKESRYIDLTKFKISCTSKEDFNPESIELRIYYKFNNTDVLYKDNYQSFDLEFDEIEEGVYQGKNEFKYYIDQRNGGIYENETEYCEPEAMPLFLPLDVNGDFKYVKYQIVFNNLGKNHDNLTFQGYLEITPNYLISDGSYGKIFNFRYVSKVPFTEVEYE